MTFQERKLIQESFFGNNKMKYATGALAGALGVAANHITGGEDNILDELKGAHEQGNLWNTILDKGQSGLESFKSDGPDTSKLKDVVDSADSGDATFGTPDSSRQSNPEMLAKQNVQSADTQNDQSAIISPGAEPLAPATPTIGLTNQNDQSTATQNDQSDITGGTGGTGSYQSRHTP